MRMYLLAWVAALSGCTAPPPIPAAAPVLPSPPMPAAAPVLPSPPSPASADPSIARYRCEQNIDFTVRFANDSAMVDAGTRGSEVLLRDAGGATPQQTVYSNARMRAEFGLGVDGREAILRYTLLPVAARCVRQ